MRRHTLETQARLFARSHLEIDVLKAIGLCLPLAAVVLLIPIGVGWKAVGLLFTIGLACWAAFGLFHDSRNLRRAYLILGKLSNRVKEGRPPSRLTCVVAMGGDDSLAVNIRYRRGSIGKYSQEPPNFRFTIKWEASGDITMDSIFAYADLPSLLEDMRAVMPSFDDYGGSLHSDSTNGILESRIAARWGIWGLLRGEETADVMYERISERVDLLRTLGTKAAAETRFAPGWIPPQRFWPDGHGPFRVGAWCLSCRKKLPTYLLDKGRTCPECGSPPLGTFYRPTFSGRDLEKKVTRLVASYSLG